jgi:capsular exopolysaccharide synthesis family protein
MMSRIHRIVEKAERDGLMTLTRGADQPGTDAPVVELPLPADAPTQSTTPIAWSEGAESENTYEPVDHPMPPGMIGIDPLLVAASEPGSAAAEQYRLLRTRLEGAEAGRRAQLLLVTSPRIGEGKTTTSANLALTMAQEFQQKVVLVEADLRRPALAALFGLPHGPGLVDVLVGAATLEDALTEVPGRHLFVLPAGLPAARSTELLGSSMMQRVLSSLRSRFDRIVVDTPPVAVADTHVLAPLCDGMLVVVRAGQTPRPAVERALEGVDRSKILGLVLNEVERPAETYAYDYGYPGQARAVGE